MKKRTAVLVLAMALSLSVVGCGSGGDTKQEEQQQTGTEIEQTETQEDTVEYDEFENSSQTDIVSEEETEPEEQSDPYDDILTKVGYDKDKTYTCDEYVEILIKISEEMGKTYNPDLLNIVKENGGKGDGFYIDQPSNVYDFSDHEKTLEDTKWIMSFFEIGRTGAENITEVYVQKIDENTVGILLKSEF